MERATSLIEPSRVPIKRWASTFMRREVTVQISPLYVRLDGLLAEIAVLEARPTAQAVVARFHAAKAMLPVAILKGRATLAFRDLGTVAFEKYPELSGAEDAVAL